MTGVDRMSVTSLRVAGWTGAALLAVALGACAPYRGWYKAGAEVTRLDTDLVQCRVSALSQVPEAVRVRREPSYYTPLRRVCGDDGAGGRDCRLVGGDFVGGAVTSYDANAPLRDRVVAQCMGARGYTPAVVPLCDRNAPVAVSSRLPALGPGTCAVRAPGGGWRFSAG